MKAKKIIVAIFLMFWLVLWPSLAEASLITIEIEAVVDSVMDEGNYLEGKVNPGDTIMGFYIYDTSTPDTNPSLYVGDYEHHTPPCSISLTVGGFEFKTDPTNVDFLVEIINDSTSGGLHDAYGLISYHNLPLSNGSSVDEISWWLTDLSATALSSTELPTTAPVLEDWQINIFNMSGSRTFGIWAHVTSAVPEPSAVLLIGLGGLLLRKRK
jgi:hypothetical protein